MEGRVFDAQVVLSPKDSPLGKVLSEYVCARVTRMDDVDVGLFDRDWNNAIYFFVLNSDEQIYMRYGGRESQSPDTYNSVESMRIALEQGLVLHRKYLQGEWRSRSGRNRCFHAKCRCWWSARSHVGNAWNAI